MTKKYAILLLASLSFSSHANWFLGTNFTEVFVKDENINLDVDFASLGLSFGYKFDHDDFFLMPELRLARGLGYDLWNNEGANTRIELDSFMALSLRLGTELRNRLQLFVSASYANFQTTISDLSPNDIFLVEQATEIEGNEVGIGVGVGYQLHSTTSVELVYENFTDELDFMSINFKFYF